MAVTPLHNERQQGVQDIVLDALPQVRKCARFRLLRTCCPAAVITSGRMERVSRRSQDPKRLTSLAHGSLVSAAGMAPPQTMRWSTCFPSAKGSWRPSAG